MSAADPSVPELPASGLLAFIQRAARDPEFDIVKFGALLDRHEAMIEHRKKDAFNAAMADVQQEIGQISQTGRNPTFVNAYAKLEDLDREARPIYSQHGFSVRYGSAPPPRDGWLRVTLTIAHRDGYSEEHYLDGPIDAQQSERRGRTAIQAVGSTVTYLRRYLLQMVLNLVPGNNPDDNDGETQRRRPDPGQPATEAKPSPQSRVDKWLDKIEGDLMACETIEEWGVIDQSPTVMDAKKGLRGANLNKLWQILSEHKERLLQPPSGDDTFPEIES